MTQTLEVIQTVPCDKHNLKRNSKKNKEPNKTRQGDLVMPDPFG